MVFSPTRQALCPSRSRNLVCKIPILCLVYQRLTPLVSIPLTRQRATADCVGHSLLSGGQARSENHSGAPPEILPCSLIDIHPVDAREPLPAAPPGEGRGDDALRRPMRGARQCAPGSVPTLRGGRAGSLAPAGCSHSSQRCDGTSRRP